MNFLSVVAKNDLEKARHILQTGIDVNSPIKWNAKNTYSPLLPPDIASRPELADQIQSNKEYHSRALNIAVIGGHADMVRLLLSAGADINLKDGRGRTALVCAIFGLDVEVDDFNPTNLPLISQTHKHHAEIMKNILLVHPNLFVSTLDAPQYEIKGTTLLCLVSHLGKGELIQLLLEDGRVNVNGTDSKSATALMYAARNGNLPIVKILLNYNASPDMTDTHGWSAIQYAGHSPEIVQLTEEFLRCKRADSNLLDDTRFPIHYTKLSNLIASIPKYPSSLSHLEFDTLSNIDLLDPVSAPIVEIIWSAFLQAIKAHDHHTLQTLLLWSPPLLPDQRPLSGPLLVNKHDTKTGLSPLHYAVRAKSLPSLDTITLLYLAGADINSQTRYGRTALHHVARFGMSKDGKSWGIQKNNKNSNNNNDPSSLGNTKQQQQHRPLARMTSLSSLTSQAFGDVGSHNDKNDNRHSSQSTTSSGSMWSCCSTEQTDLMQSHILAASTIPQHLAMCASLLIRLGALVNIADTNGNTPLHFAAEFGGVSEVLEVLIMEGNADVTLKNKKGLTPVDICCTEEIKNRIVALEQERKTKPSCSYAGNNIKPFDDVSEYKSGLSRSASRSTLQSAAAAARQADRRRRNSGPGKGSMDALDEDDIDRNFEKILKAFLRYQTTFTESIESALAEITVSILDTAQLSAEEHVKSTVQVYGTITRLRLELQEAHDMFDDTDQRVESVMLHYREELEQVEQIHQADWDMSEMQCDKVEKLYDVFERIDGRFTQLEQEQEELIDQLELMRKTALRYAKDNDGVCNESEFTNAMTNLTQSLVILDTVSVDPALYSREDIDRLNHDIGEMVKVALHEIDKRNHDPLLAEVKETIVLQWEKVHKLLTKPEEEEKKKQQHNGIGPNIPLPPLPVQTLRPRHWERQNIATRIYSRRKAAPEGTLNELELSFEILHANQIEIQKDLDSTSQQAAQMQTLKRTMYDAMLKLEAELAMPEAERKRQTAEIKSELEGVLLKTKQLFDQNGHLEKEREQLRTELASVEKQLETVQNKLQKTRPPVLLQGLLERLETDMGPIVRTEKDWREDPSLVAEVFFESESEDTSTSSGGGSESGEGCQPPWLDRFKSQLAVNCLVARLDASLYCLKVLAKNHISRSYQILLEVQATLVQANTQLEETRNQMNALYDDAAEVAHQVFSLKTELEKIVNDRKEEIVKVWEVVEEVSGGIDMSVITGEEQLPLPTVDRNTEHNINDDQEQHQRIIHELEQLQNVHENLQDAVEELQREQETIDQNLRHLANELIEPQVDKLVGQGEESLLTVSDRLAELMERVCQGEYGLLSAPSGQAAPPSRASKRFSVATQASLRSNTSRSTRERGVPPRSSAAMSVRSKRMSVISTSSFASLSTYQQERMLERVSSLSSALSQSRQSAVRQRQ